jgi:hypothetical protein
MTSFKTNTLFDPIFTGISAEEKHQQAISSITNPDGVRTILSRYGDENWDLSPFIKTSNNGNSKMRIKWNTRDLNQNLINSCKDATLAYWKYGIPGKKRPEATTVLTFGFNLLWVSEFLQKLGLTRFAQINTHVANDYIAWVKGSERNLKPSSQETYLSILETLFYLHEYLNDSITSHPWPGRTASQISGRPGSTSRQASTKIIPQNVARALFQKAEAFLDSSEKFLEARADAMVVLAKSSNLHNTTASKRARAVIASAGLKVSTKSTLNPTEFSTACYIIIAMLSGMRNHEISSIKTNAYYESVIDGEVIGWLKGESHKTFEGNTEWMVPPLVGRAIAIQQKLSEEWRNELSKEKAELEQEIKKEKYDTERKDILLRLQSVNQDIDKIFVTKGKQGPVGNLIDSTWNQRLRNFAKEFDWHLTTHQFRRTFATYVASHAMGDLRYLRHHFKHWSLDMTLLYARNEKQDQHLYDEMLSAIEDRKISIVEHWLDEMTPISGGNVGRLKEYKKREDVRTLKDKRSLAAYLSDTISIRGTGHSWCTSAGMNGCGGKGLYEMTQCIGCGEGIIDDTQKVVWMNIYEQQKELLELEDIGPGGQQRVRRDIEKIEKVLTDLECAFEPIKKDES